MSSSSPEDETTQGVVVYEPSVDSIRATMEKATRAFRECRFSEAAAWFKEACQDCIHVHGRNALDSASAYFMYGLALLCEVPVPADDPMTLLPKEVDYYRDSSDDGSPSVFPRQESGVLQGRYYSKLEDAGKELDIAWSIVKNQPRDSIEKVNILSALGEIAFRQGNLPPAQCYYFRALSILEKVVGQSNKRIADINVKICICLERRYWDEEAIQRCEKAISIYQIHLKAISTSNSTAETLTSPELNLGSSSVPTTDPSIERNRLIRVISYLIFKLGVLKRRLHQSSASSGSCKGLLVRGHTRRRDDI